MSDERPQPAPGTYHIELTERPEVTVASIREHMPPSDLSQRVAETLGEVFDWLSRNGIAPVGPPFMRIHELGPSDWDIEVGIPVAERFTPTDERVRPSTLPGGPKLVSWHIGPYDTLSDAFDALESYAEALGRAYEPGWEVYYVGPEDEPDPAKWRTEVILPLAS